MSEQQTLSRLFGGCFNNGLFGGGGIILIILLVLLILGDDFIEFLFCEDNLVIWVILIILLLMNFDDGCGIC